MNATDSLLAISKNRVQDSVLDKHDEVKGKKGHKGRGVKAKANKELGNANTEEQSSNEGLNAIFDIIEQFANKSGTGEKYQDNVAELLLAALNNSKASESDASKDNRESKQTRTKEKSIKLLENINKCITGEPLEDTTETKTEEESKKKLVSGKCAKPDDTDIQMVVKYPHEKFNAKHIQDRNFISLEFNFLIAGELEIISFKSIPTEERNARVEVAKILCYHKRYLDDGDLREGYDSIMKQIEQGKLKWMDEVSQKLHEHLDYRANVNMRRRVEAQQSGGFIKVEN